MIQTPILTKHYRVKGKVQGVWFRAHTQKVARSLSLTGWVCNVSDGCVEVVATGTSEQHQAFEKALCIGSPLSKVSEVQAKDLPLQSFPTFDIQR